MAKHPESPETRTAHQEVLWHFGYEHFEYAEAEPWARLIIERFPGTWAAADATIDLAAFIVEMRRDFTEAYLLIDEGLAWARAQEDWSLVAAGLSVRARLLTKEHRFAEAREDLTQLLVFIDQHPEAEWLRVQTEAEHAAAYVEEGSTLLSQGDEAGAKACLMSAVAEYAAALDRHADDAGWAPYLKHQIGFAYLLAGERDAAKQAFIRLVKDHPDDCWSWVVFDCMDLGMERPERPATVRMAGEDEQ